LLPNGRIVWPPCWSSRLAGRSPLDAGVMIARHYGRKKARRTGTCSFEATNLKKRRPHDPIITTNKMALSEVREASCHAQTIIIAGRTYSGFCGGIRGGDTGLAGGSASPGFIYEWLKVVWVLCWRCWCLWGPYCLRAYQTPPRKAMTSDPDL
jgi:hypothetical protein